MRIRLIASGSFTCGACRRVGGRTVVTTVQQPQLRLFHRQIHRTGTIDGNLLARQQNAPFGASRLLPGSASDHVYFRLWRCASTLTATKTATKTAVKDNPHSPPKQQLSASLEPTQLTLTEDLNIPFPSVSLGRTGDLALFVSSVASIADKFIASHNNKIADSEHVIKLLKKLQSVTETVVDAATTPVSTTTSTLIGLAADSRRSGPATATSKASALALQASRDDDRPTVRAPQATNTPRARRPPEGDTPPTIDFLSGPYRDAVFAVSNAAFHVVDHPNVLITEPILDNYVRLQCRLGMPQSIGYMFEQYAKKDIPFLAQTKVKYYQPNPNRLASVTPSYLAEMALDTAIATRDLSSVASIIETAYNTKAARMRRWLRKAALPMAAWCILPVLIWKGSWWAATFQNVMDPTEMMVMVFGGFMTCLCVSTAAYVIPVMSRPGDVKRVSWLSGIPLRHRWLHEDQRQAYDKVAMAWGYKDKAKYGNEDFDNWLVMKQHCGCHGMLIDPFEFLEGN